MTHLPACAVPCRCRASQDVALLEPLQRLVTMCQSVQEPAFEYDVNYCSRNLSWLVEVLEVRCDGSVLARTVPRPSGCVRA